METMSRIFLAVFVISQIFGKEAKLISGDASPRRYSQQVISLQTDRALSDRERLLIEHVKACIEKTEREQSKVSEGILRIEGMSSPKGRHLLNNLCSLPHTRYLEIGCWKGSTFVSALYGNSANMDLAIGIDNWSEFGAPWTEFQNHCNQYLDQSSYKFYSSDCFSINPADIIQKPINIYFYDADHSAIAQEMAFTHYNEVFDDVFIAIVDDWYWVQGTVKEGTVNAFCKLDYEILFEADLPEYDPPEKLGWWNGMYIAVIKKVKK